MGRCGLIFRFPAFPFSLETLLPDDGAARLCGALVVHKHTVRIVDLGTAGIFERLYPVDFRGALLGMVAGGRSVSDDIGWIGWPLKGLSRVLRDRYRKVARDTCVAISREAMDFAVIAVDGPLDWGPGSILAGELRGQFPDAVIVAWDRSGGPSRPLRRRTPFDAVFAGDHPTTVLAGLHRLLGTKAPARESSARAAYSLEQYPALGEGGKVNLLTVDDGCGRRKARDTGDVVAELQRVHGVSAFHVTGGHGFSTSTESFASEITHRRLSIRYSREAAVATMTPSVLAAARLSGCEVLAYRIDSGSQRLLDDFYENPFNVSTAERVLALSRSSGAYTVAELTFPCAEDDFHTRDETLRMIDHARPQAAWISIHSGCVSRRAIRQRAEFRQSIETFGVTTGVTARSALLGRIAGYEDRPGELVEQFRMLFLTGEMDGIFGGIEELSQALGQQTNRDGFRPFVIHRKAVGN